MNGRTFSQSPRKRGKKPPPPSTTYYCAFSVRLSRCRVPGVEHLATKLTVQRIGQLATNTGQRERAVFFFFAGFVLVCCFFNLLSLELYCTSTAYSGTKQEPMSCWRHLLYYFCLNVKKYVKYTCCCCCVTA